jgi:hypothetical protein
VLKNAGQKRRIEMRKSWQMALVPGIAVVVLAFAIGAVQQPKGVPQESKTQLEDFEKQTGAVIIKGFLTLGAVSGMGDISVDCMEFTNVSTGIIPIIINFCARHKSNDICFE